MITFTDLAISSSSFVFTFQFVRYKACYIEGDYILHTSLTSWPGLVTNAGSSALVGREATHPFSVFVVMWGSSAMALSVPFVIFAAVFAACVERNRGIGLFII